MASVVLRAVTPKPYSKSVLLFEMDGKEHKTYQRSIVHAQDNDTGMFWALLAPSANMSLDDVTSIQERHLSIRLDPDLVSSMRGNDIEGGDVQSELARLCELAETGTEGEEGVAGD